MLGCQLAPGSEAVHAAVGHLALSIEQAAFACPGVRDAVEDEHVVTGRLCLMNGFDVLVDLEWGLDVENIEVDAICIEDAGVVLSVDESNLCPETACDLES